MGGRNDLYSKSEKKSQGLKFENGRKLKKGENPPFN